MNAKSYGVAIALIILACIFFEVGKISSGIGFLGFAFLHCFDALVCAIKEKP